MQPYLFLRHGLCLFVLLLVFGMKCANTTPNSASIVFGELPKRLWFYFKITITLLERVNVNIGNLWHCNRFSIALYYLWVALLPVLLLKCKKNKTPTKTKSTAFKIKDKFFIYSYLYQKYCLIMYKSNPKLKYRTKIAIFYNCLIFDVPFIKYFVSLHPN